MRRRTDVGTSEDDHKNFELVNRDFNRRSKGEILGSCENFDDRDKEGKEARVGMGFGDGLVGGGWGGGGKGGGGRRGELERGEADGELGGSLDGGFGGEKENIRIRVGGAGKLGFGQRGEVLVKDFEEIDLTESKSLKILIGKVQERTVEQVVRRPVLQLLPKSQNLITMSKRIIPLGPIRKNYETPEKLIHIFSKSKSSAGIRNQNSALPSHSWNVPGKNLESDRDNRNYFLFTKFTKKAYQLNSASLVGNETQQNLPSSGRLGSNLVAKSVNISKNYGEDTPATESYFGPDALGRSGLDVPKRAQKIHLKGASLYAVHSHPAYHKNPDASRKNSVNSVSTPYDQPSTDRKNTIPLSQSQKKKPAQPSKQLGNKSSSIPNKNLSPAPSPAKYQTPNPTPDRPKPQPTILQNKDLAFLHKKYFSRPKTPSKNPLEAYKKPKPCLRRPNPVKKANKYFHNTNFVQSKDSKGTGFKRSDGGEISGERLMGSGEELMLRGGYGFLNYIRDKCNRKEVKFMDRRGCMLLNGRGGSRGMSGGEMRS